MKTYSYDRTARRNVGDIVDGLKSAVETAQQAVKVGSEYVRQTEDLFRFLQVPVPTEDGKTFLTSVTKIAKELPGVLTAADQLDDAIDAYARKVRRGLPRNHEDEFDSSDLDEGTVRDFQRRAEALIDKLMDLSKLATDLPVATYSIDEYYDSPKITAINEMADQMDNFSSDLMFDETDLTGFLENLEDNLVEYINRRSSV